MLQNGMQLNPEKTQAILIGSQQNLKKIEMQTVPMVRVNDLAIEFSTTVKYLGFTFNETFNSSDHVYDIIKKVNFPLVKLIIANVVYHQTQNYGSSGALFCRSLIMVP